MDSLAEAIAQKVNKKEEKEDREKAEAERKAGDWEEGTEWLMCKPCTAQSNLPDVPYVFRHAAKKELHFGLISKKESDGTDKPRWRLNGRLSDHTKNALHAWCVMKDLEVKKIVKTFEEENQEVGIIVHMAYLKIARRGGSASDFQNDIDFLHLIPKLAKSKKKQFS